MAILSAVLFCRGALADVNSCTTQHTSGQREVRAGHLKVASEQFAACSSDSACPETIRAECAELLTNTTQAMPTVVFSVRDEKGQQLTTVKVFAADELIAERLDGNPISLDPGKHRFRFVLPSGDVLSTDELIREGEKNRVIAVGAERTEPVAPPGPVTSAPSTAGGQQPVQSAMPPPAEAKPRPRLPAGFWIASGIGAAALVSFSTFALLGRSIHSELADCSPTCGPDRRDDYDALKRDYMIADISLGVAVLSVGTAAYIYFVSNPSRSRTEAPTAIGPAPRVGLAVLLGGGGAQARVSHAF